MGTARTGRRLLTVVSVALFLSVILPNLLTIDQVPLSLAVAWSEEALSPQDVPAHAAHCHYGVSACAQDSHAHGHGSSWWVAEARALTLDSFPRGLAPTPAAFDIPQPFLSPPEKPPRSF